MVLPGGPQALPIPTGQATCQADGADGTLGTMTRPPGTRPAPQRIPLSVDEKNRAEVNFAPYVARTLVSEGRFRVSADTADMVELFQKVARRVGDMLRRPMVSYANGREIVITFGQDDAYGLTGQDRSRGLDGVLVGCGHVGASGGSVPDQDAGLGLVQPPSVGLLAPVMVPAQRRQVALARQAALVPGHGVVQVAAGRGPAAARAVHRALRARIRCWSLRLGW